VNVKLIEEVANAVLYEGYLLYPYRASAVKNRKRWNFGVVYPRAYAERQTGPDSWQMHIECLARGEWFRARVRFLQLIARETLDDSGAVADTWEEAVEREVAVETPSIAAWARGPHHRAFSFAAAVEREPDRIVRRRESLAGSIEMSAEEIAAGWFRVLLTIANTEPFEGGGRERALLQSFVSTHAILSLGAGEFASLLDPPGNLKKAAEQCRNIGAYPVLAGEPGSRGAMLCSPVILYDYPQIAPESAGALFDGTEIDEILSLRILTMTPEEKSEMRGADEYARQILERTESLTPEQFMNMHGTMRGRSGWGEAVRERDRDESRAPGGEP
jgi:hypothetical protein